MKTGKSLARQVSLIRVNLYTIRIRRMQDASEMQEALTNEFESLMEKIEELEEEIRALETTVAGQEDYIESLEHGGDHDGLRIVEGTGGLS